MGVNVSTLPDFNAGDTQTLHVHVTYKQPVTSQQNVTVTVNQLDNITVNNPVNTVTFKVNDPPVVGGQQTADVNFSVKASSNVPPGQTVNGKGTVTVDDGAHSGTVDFQAAIHGPAAAPSPTPTTVPSVTGTVKDRATGAAVADAQVTMQDDERHTFTTGTNNAGAFSFTSSPSNPISPGTLAFVITKDGYDQRNLTADGKAGQALNVPIVLAATAASASAAPSDTTSASPVDSPGNVVAPTAGAGAGSGGGGLSSLLIVMGAVLVLLGVGAIALILWRRKADNGPSEDDDGSGPPRRGPTPVPASRGAYRGAPAEATSVMRGGGGYGDPTAVARPLAEAPTMMQRPVADEFPDPYGAPDPRTSPNYGAPTQYQGGGGYGAPAGGYSAPAGYGSPGGFGSPAGNPGYNDPTRYEPPSSGGGYGGQGGYDSQPAGGYPRPADPYGTPHAQGHDYGAGSSGYGSGPGGGYDQGGYESGGGYHAGGGGYQQESTRRYDGGGAGNGYDPQPPSGGHSGQGGYQPTQGYQPAPEYPPTSGGGHQGGGGYQGESGGYGNDYEPRGGYQRRGGYQQQQRGGHDAPPEQRRSLDWLDD